MPGKNIVMFNMSTASEWESGVVNRNFFVLQEMLKDPRVDKILSVDIVPIFGPRPMGFRRLIGYYWSELFRSRFVNHEDTNVLRHNIFSRLVKKGEKLYQYSSVTAFFSPMLFYAEINRLIGRHLGPENLVVWSYNPLMVRAFKKIPGAFKVFDMVDNWCTHPVYKKWKNVLPKRYESIGRLADKIFVVSKESLPFFKDQSKVSWVPNGIDWEMWASVKQTTPLLFKKPIIGYVGTIQERFDFDLVRFLAQQNPNYSFVLIGPIWRSVLKEFESKLSGLANVYALGRKPYKETAALVRNFDVAMITHRPSAFTDSNNPLKMYEYLAAGRKVISTPLAGVDMFAPYIVTANGASEFNAKLRELVDAPEHDTAQRIEAVKAHSWHQRVDAMLNLI